MRIKAKRENPVDEKGKPSGFIGFIRDAYYKYRLESIAPGLIVVIIILYFLDIFDMTTITFIVGFTFLLFIFGVFLYKVLTSDFKRWCKVGTYIAFPIFLIAIVYPFFRFLYPGEPILEKDLTNEIKEVEVQGITEAGDYNILITATNFSESAGHNIRGDYHIILGGQDIKGTFSDEMKTTRVGRRGSRQVEKKHLVDRHIVHFDSKVDKIIVGNLDSRMGGKVKIQVYHAGLPFVLSVILIILLICFSIIFDVGFQKLTKKLLLSPFLIISGIFIMILPSSYDASQGIMSIVWIILLSCAGGFLGGWLITWILRKIYNRYIKAKIYS